MSGGGQRYLDVRVDVRSSLLSFVSFFIRPMDSAAVKLKPSAKTVELFGALAPQTFNFVVQISAQAIGSDSKPVTAVILQRTEVGDQNWFFATRIREGSFAWRYDKIDHLNDTSWLVVDFETRVRNQRNISASSASHESCDPQ